MLKIKYLLPVLGLFLLTACAKKTIAPSLATLKPLMRLKVVDKASFPETVIYNATLYNDQRLELSGNANIDKIGNYTTMLNAREQADFIASVAKFKRGHFTFLQNPNQTFYDVIYYPLKKEISMSDAIQLPETPDMQAFVSKINDFLTYKKWLKKENAPKILSDKEASDMIVTLKVNTTPNEIIKSEKYAGIKLKAIMQTDMTSNTWLFGFAPEVKVNDAVYKIKSHPNVLGAVPNTLLIVEDNLKVYENQELIVQFKGAESIEEWVKTYAANEMKSLGQVAPDMNYWVVSYNSATLGAKEMLTRIKADPKVVEAQLNRKVSNRE
jgi:ASC-1-like (ASCH) protein